MSAVGPETPYLPCRAPPPPHTHGCSLAFELGNKDHCSPHLKAFAITLN